VSNDCVHAVVEAFDVHLHNTIEIFFGRALDRADVRNSGIVNQDMDALMVEQFSELRLHILLVGYIAKVGGGGAASGCDLLARRTSGRFVNIEYANDRALRRKC
jgi:hypothetical protein